MKSKGMLRLGTLVCSAALIAITPQLALAQVRTAVSVRAQALEQSLKDVARQTRTNILFTPDAVRMVRSPAINGHMNAAQAVRMLLKGTSLEAVSDGDGGLIVRRKVAGRFTPPRAPARTPARLSQRPSRGTPAQGAASSGRPLDSAPAAVDTAPGRMEERPAEDIVVTGSRIQQGGFQAPTPVTVVTAEQLNQAAPQGVAAGLNQLPQLLGSLSPTQTSPSTLTSRGNYLNLRNVGINRTLILMDGVRVPPTSQEGTVDVDFVPEMLVSRVDVVTAGVSAVYGADAVTGVVNFVLDKRFTGIKGMLQGSITSRGDNEQYRVGLAAGTSFAEGRGHMLAMFERRQVDGILRTDRPLMNGNWGQSARYAMGQMKPDGIVAGAPGTATNPIAFEKNVASRSSSKNGSINQGPASIAGNAFTFDDSGKLIPFVHGTPLGSSFEINGTGQITPADSSMTSDDRVNHAFGRLSYDLTDGVTIFAEGNYQASKVHWNAASDFTPIPIFSGNAFLDPQVQAVLGDPARNVGNTAGVGCGAIDANGVQGLCLTKFPIDDPRLRMKQDLEVKAYSVKAGFEGKIFETWSWNLSYIHGRSRSDGRERQRDLQHFYAAIDAVRAPAGNGLGIPAGTIVCRVTLVAPGVQPGCVPFNPMVFGGHSRAAIDYTMGESRFTTVNTTDDVILTIDGSPLELPAGPVGIAFSAEYRAGTLRQTSNARPDVPYSTTGIRGVLNPGLHYGSTNRAFAEGSNEVTEANAEVGIPLLSDRPFAHSLAVSGAARWTDYSTSGTVWTWKLGGTYEPIPELRIRATRSRDIRAPALFDLYAGRTQATQSLQDPHCGCQGTRPLAVFGGGNPDLRPERADTFTFGGVVSDIGWLPGFMMSVDYYDLKIHDAITTLTALRVAEICEESSGAGPICAGIVRPFDFSNRTPDNTPISIFAGRINASLLHTRGVDFEAAYSARALGGNLGLRLLGTYVLNYKTQSSRLDPLIESAGYTLNQIPHLRGNLSINYANGPFSIFFQERMVGSLKAGPTLVYEVSKLPAVFYSDITIKYDWEMKGGNVETFLTVNNLFDKQPPIWPPVIPGLTYPTFQSLYDVVGTNFTTGIRFKF